ncbi:helix-turn-helix domain-containing protein [Providencia hangzhouensis]|uniref:helix-turn-helix domain-containing protein n=1 Tax=Providencia hangzhouensis TaxID=3031799 RepID=UPI0034DD1409
MLGGQEPIKFETKKGATNFGLRLKEVMGEQSTVSFAKKCGVSEASIRKYLKNGTLPSIDKIEAIAKYTERSLAWLITGEEEKHSTLTKTSALTSEEFAKWWNVLADALTPSQKEKIIEAFKQGGINAIFLAKWVEKKL